MTTQRWTAVAEAIDAKLTELGWLQADLVRESGLSPEGVRPVMKGLPGNYRAATLAKIAIALGWSGDSIQRILAGKKPVDAESGGRISARLAAVEDRLARIEDLVAELVDQRRPAR